MNEGLTLPCDQAATACFTGHRLIGRDVLPHLSQVLDERLEQWYQAGYRTFISGGALGFDTLAAERVSVLRCARPDVRLVLALPCADQDARWTAVERAHFQRMRYLADQVRVLAPFYDAGCMHARNRFMVDQSSLCICFFRYAGGGTQYTVSYALRNHVTIHNLNDDMQNPL